jgi:hypothetical protein
MPAKYESVLVPYRKRLLARELFAGRKETHFCADYGVSRPTLYRMKKSPEFIDEWAKLTQAAKDGTTLPPLVKPNPDDVIPESPDVSNLPIPKIPNQPKKTKNEPVLEPTQPLPDQISEQILGAEDPISAARQYLRRLALIDSLRVYALGLQPGCHPNRAQVDMANKLLTTFGVMAPDIESNGEVAEVQFGPPVTEDGKVIQLSLLEGGEHNDPEFEVPDVSKQEKTA